MPDDSRGYPDVRLEPGGDATAIAQPFTATRVADMDAAFAGAFLRARAELDVQSFGISILLLQPNSTGYPEHDHTRDHQEFRFSTKPHLSACCSRWRSYCSS